MDKTWSYMFNFSPDVTGTIVIKQRNTGYELYFHEHFGDKRLMYNDDNLEAIWSFLLTTKSIETEHGLYTPEMSKLGIPTNLNDWTVVS